MNAPRQSASIISLKDRRKTPIQALTLEDYCRLKKAAHLVLLVLKKADRINKARERTLDKSEAALRQQQRLGEAGLALLEVMGDILGEPTESPGEEAP